MEGIIITHKGLESVAVLEVKELLNRKAKKVVAGAVFTLKKIEDLADVIYQSQSAKRVLFYFGSFKVGKLEATTKNIQKLIEGLKFEDSLKNVVKNSFSMDCERLGEHDFNSVDIEEVAGKAFRKKTGIKADFKNPHFVVHISIHDNIGHMGIDFANKDLSKRSYKIYNYGSGIKGTLSYGIIRLAGFEKDKILVDPSCGTGTIAIEAALYQSGKSPHFYEKQFQFTNYFEFDYSQHDPKKDMVIKNVTAADAKQKYVSAAKKNAKVAGINLTTTRMDMEWLDTKFDKGKIDCLVSKPIVPSKVVSEKIAEKIYKDLFYNAGYIIKKEGVLAILTQKPDFVKKMTESFPLKLDKEYSIESGHIYYDLLLFKKVE